MDKGKNSRLDVNSGGSLIETLMLWMSMQRIWKLIGDIHETEE